MCSSSLIFVIFLINHGFMLPVLSRVNLKSVYICPSISLYFSYILLSRLPQAFRTILIVWLQLKATIAESHGDLEAQERAAATEQVDVDDDSDCMLPKMKNRRKSDEADSALGMMQNRLKESSQVIQSLAAARTEQPANPKRSSFVNYVKDTLLQFSERKYKKAKSTITKLIMNLDENDSESEDLQYHFDRGNVPACNNLRSHSTQSLAKPRLCTSIIITEWIPTPVQHVETHFVWSDVTMVFWVYATL